MKKLKQKLKQNKGETLSEVLVALLIASIATAMFAAMIKSSGNIIETSSDSLDAYYAANDVLISQNLSTPDSSSVRLDLQSIRNQGTTVAKTGTIQLRPAETSIPVSYYPNSESSKVPVASYKISETQQEVDGNG